MTNQSLETRFWTLAFVHSVLSIAGVPVTNPVKAIVNLLMLIITAVQIIRWWRSRRQQH